MVNLFHIIQKSTMKQFLNSRFVNFLFTPVPRAGVLLTRPGPTSFNVLSTANQSSSTAQIPLDRIDLSPNANNLVKDGVHERHLQPSLFQSYTLRELLRGLAVLKICSNPFFVKRASKLHQLSSSVLGSSFTNRFLESLLFRHFVAGDRPHELEAAVGRFAAHGVGPMILPPMEDLSEEVCDGMDTICERNREKYMEFVDLCRSIAHKFNRQSLLQFKLSSVIATPAMNAFSASLAPTHESLFNAANKIGNFLKNEKSGAKDTAFLEEPVLNKLFKDGLQHCKTLFQHAAKSRVPVLVDAELKDAHLAMYAVYLGTGTVFCKEAPDVFVTYQCYMKDIPELLRLSADVAVSLDQCFAVKLVRGAYLEQEREIAAARGLPDPTWPSLEATSASYNGAVEFILGRAKERPGRVRVCVATHNQDSIDKAVKLIKKLAIDPNDGNVFLAQILGMCDSLTSELGSRGFTVYKSIAYGRADEWIPYLARRASENHTALSTARNELPLYRAEIKRRLTMKQ